MRAGGRGGADDRGAQARIGIHLGIFAAEVVQTDCEEPHGDRVAETDPLDFSAQLEFLSCAR